MSYTQKRSPLKQLSGSTYGPINKVNKIATIGTPTSISTPREKEERTVISPSGSGYINASEAVGSQIKKKESNNLSTSSIELPEVTDNSLKRIKRKEKRDKYKTDYKDNIKPFTASVPVDSSFSSMMAATAQNIAKHLGSSISARKTAKLMGNKPSLVEPMTSKEGPKSFALPAEKMSIISPKEDLVKSYADNNPDPSGGSEETKTPSIDHPVTIKRIENTRKREGSGKDAYRREMSRIRSGAESNIYVPEYEVTPNTKAEIYKIEENKVNKGKANAEELINKLNKSDDNCEVGEDCGINMSSDAFGKAMYRKSKYKK